MFILIPKAHATQPGVEFEHYLCRCQCIPVTFRTPQYALLSKIYCELMFILIVKAPGTWGGAGTIFDYIPKHSCYIYSITKIGPVQANTTRKK